MNISDHGENDPIPFELSPAEKDAAAHMQAGLRFCVSTQNQISKGRELYLIAERQFHHHNKGDA